LNNIHIFFDPLSASAKDSDTQMIAEFEYSFQSMSEYILKKGKEGNISQVSTAYFL